MRLLRSLLAAWALLAFAFPVDAAVAPERPAGQSYFSVDDLVHGKELTKGECDALPLAVWASADGSAECLRYFISPIMGEGEAVVLLHGDFVNADNGAPPQVTAADYARTSPEDEMQDAGLLAEHFGRTAIVLARPGTFGSSGSELKMRHTVHEARLVDAALDLIGARYGIRRFHLVGQSGGAILIGALLAMRSDIACASLGSGRLALSPVAARDRDLTRQTATSLLDDAAYVGSIRPSPALRAFVISDPSDIRSSFAGQSLFVVRARGKGVPVMQVSTVASFDNGAHHELLGQALRVLIECVDGASDERIGAIVQHFAHENARTWAQHASAPRLRQISTMRASSGAASAEAAR